MLVLHILTEESVSQILYLDPTFYFRGLTKLCFENIQKVTLFLT